MSNENSSILRCLPCAASKGGGPTCGKGRCSSATGAGPLGHCRKWGQVGVSVSSRAATRSLPRWINRRPSLGACALRTLIFCETQKPFCPIHVRDVRGRRMLLANFLSLSFNAPQQIFAQFHLILVKRKFGTRKLSLGQLNEVVNL